MPADPLTVLFWFFVLSFTACATLYLALGRGRRVTQRRLQDLAVKFRLNEGDYNEQEVWGRGLAKTLLELARRQLPAPNLQRPAVEKLVQTIQYAGFYDPDAARIFRAVRLLVSFASGLLFALAAVFSGTSALLPAFFGAGCGYLASLYYVKALAVSRQRRTRRELPDVIDLLVVCVECGLGLLAAIRIVGRECEQQGKIIGAQLATLSAELAAGASLGDGLRGIAQRTGVDDLRTISAILVQSEKLGTEMAQALRVTAEQLRARRSMRAEEMAQKLPVKMIIPLIAFLLPAMMLIMVGPAMIQIYRSFNFH
jgi:tight adherence protein C